jgi:phosphatidylglycerophosphatase C
VELDPAPRTGVLFDFDGTLTRGDTMAGFFVYCARRNPRRAVPMLVSWLITAPLGLLPGGQRWVNSAILWWATVGLGRRGTVRLLRDYAERLAGCGDLLQPGGMRRLQEHRDRGECLWVVSASCRQWIRPVLAAAGLGDVVVVASSFAFRWGGLVMARRCHGRGKPEALARRARPGTWRWAWSYGDRRSDMPILRLAEHQGLVGPGRQAGRVQKELGDSAVLLDWRAADPPHPPRSGPPGCKSGDSVH